MVRIHVFLDPRGCPNGRAQRGTRWCRICIYNTYTFPVPKPVFGLSSGPRVVISYSVPRGGAPNTLPLR